MLHRCLAYLLVVWLLLVLIGLISVPAAAPSDEEL
jgi:hypothetical protein